MGAAARPFMFRAAICCIWAAAKAAMGFRYPPCATEAMIAACCCISWNKESREKISRGHGRGSLWLWCQEGARCFGVHPRDLGCQHTTPLVPPRLGHSRCRGWKQRVSAVWGLCGPSVEVSCDPAAPWYFSGQKGKSLYRQNTIYLSRVVSWLTLLISKFWKSLEVTDERLVYVEKGDPFSKAEILTSSLGKTWFFPSVSDKTHFFWCC